MDCCHSSENSPPEKKTAEQPTAPTKSSWGRYVVGAVLLGLLAYLLISR